MRPVSNRRPRLAVPAAALLGAVFWTAPVFAADHCIAAGNVAQLQQALDTAAASDEDDTIRLEAGSYSVVAGLDYPLAPGFRGGARRLLGGFNAGCGSSTHTGADARAFVRRRRRQRSTRAGRRL